MIGRRNFQMQMPTNTLPQAEGVGFSPARLDSAQTARFLGFQEHDIPVLVSIDLLEPLGKPAPNARKYFAAVEIFELAQDRNWLNKATRVLYQHWQDKNANRKDESASVALAN